MSDTSDKDVVRAYLHEHAGTRICYVCLTATLSLEDDAVRRARWLLRDEPGVSIRHARCVICRKRRMTIGVSSTLTVAVPAIRVAEQISEDRGLGVVIDFLAETPGEAYCALCIAFTTNLGLAESRAVLHHLAAAPEFARNEAPCSTCGRVQIVVRANRGGAERLATLGDVLSGSVLHRGFRIDVRSFKTAAGWRPFALVRTDAGTLVPSAPAIVCGLMPSKLEADELAMAEARFWIEKRFLLSS